MYNIHKIVLGRWKVNCYILDDSKNALLIDAGSEPAPIINYLRSASLSLKAILISHAHFDHIEGICEIKKSFNAPIYMHSKDKKVLGQMNLFRTVFDKEKPTTIPTVDFDLSGISELKITGLSLEVIHTPGHTQGGVSFRDGSNLFTGDTLMQGKLGRTDLPGSNEESLKSSLEKLLQLPSETIVYPGHGEIFKLQEAQMKRFPSDVLKL